MLIAREINPRMLLAALAATVSSGPAAAASAGNPTVVELFQSQGCSSCPPANAMLNRLADRADLLPLTASMKTASLLLLRIGNGLLLILVPGALVLWRYLLDPMGMYLLDKESSQILFFPSITVAAATLVLLAFRDEDLWTFDHKLLASRTAA